MTTHDENTTNSDSTNTAAKQKTPKGILKNKKSAWKIGTYKRVRIVTSPEEARQAITVITVEYNSRKCDTKLNYGIAATLILAFIAIPITLAANGMILPVFRKVGDFADNKLGDKFALFYAGLSAVATGLGVLTAYKAKEKINMLENEKLASISRIEKSA